MTTYVPATLIKELEEALTNSVPSRYYSDAITALKRCQEIIGRLAATIEDLDVRHAHSDLMFEAKLYANVLGGLFNEKDTALVKWTDVGKGYNPREYLADKGVIKPVNPTRVKMEEQFAAFRQAKQNEINQILLDLEWKRAQQKLKREQRKIAKAEPLAGPVIEVGPAHEYINKLRAEHGRGPIKPASKRGRPAGSKNKPKTGIVSKVNAILKANKKGTRK
tara:strand:+ start:3158 stop:3820 length:663 start_codon:yes stop_codon:yes gene_type:complete